MPPRIPKYRRRPDRDIAFAEFPRGNRAYFPGRYDSPESRAAYSRWLRAILGDPDAAVELPPNPGNVAVIDAVSAFLDWAKLYYMADGKKGSEYHCLCSAIVPLLKAADTVPARDFGPNDLKRVRKEMIARGWTRQTVNDQVGRVRRIFKWCVEHELVPASVWQSLQAVAPIRRGRTELKEGNQVEPVDEALVLLVLSRVGPVVSAMIRLQQITGMRSQDVCQLRPCDVDQSGDIWIYRPPKHKGTWRGDTRVVVFGPKAQEILRPWLNRPANSFCFSPIESEAARQERRIAEAATHRKRPRPPSKRAKPLRTHYDTASYRRAIHYAIDVLNREATKRAAKESKPAPTPIPRWHPHQLRHNRATAVRSQYGIEAAQVYLGHARADVTQVYAERDLELAKRVARETG